MSSITPNIPEFSSPSPGPENIPKGKTGRQAGLVESAVKSINVENLASFPSISSKELIPSDSQQTDSKILGEFSNKVPAEVKRVNSEDYPIASDDEEFGTILVSDVPTDDEEYGTTAIEDVLPEDEDLATFVVSGGETDDEEYGTVAMPDDSSSFESSMPEEPLEEVQGNGHEKTDNSSVEKRAGGRLSPSEILHKKEIIGKGASGEIHLTSMTREKLGALEGAVPKTSDQAKSKEKKVAVKEFTDIHDRELSVVKDLREANAPGIPTLYGTLTSDEGKVHTVMKHLNGGNYRSYFSEIYGDKRECLDRLIGVMDLVAKFHEKGCCHRDIHEGNIVRHTKKGGEVQDFLVDFGHAAVADKSGSIGKLPLMLANCPPDIIAAYPLKGKSKEEAEASGLKDEDFAGYEALVDQKGKQIDQFQLGMMIFRVMTATGSLGEVQRNPNQLKLMTFLMNKEAEYSQDPSKRENFRPDVLKFLEDTFPGLPPQVCIAIGGLLDSNNPMPIPRAINILKRVQFD